MDIGSLLLFLFLTFCPAWINDRNQEEEVYAATRSIGVPYLKEG